MVIRYRNIRHPVLQLRNEMDRLLSGFVAPTLERSWPHGRRDQPAVNLWESDNSLLVEMEVPGLKTDQLDISIVGDELSVKIERAEVEQQGITHHRRERPVGAFTRVLRLPAEVDAQKVAAELHDGILTIFLPKAETAKPRKIEVTSA